MSSFTIKHWPLYCGEYLPWFCSLQTAYRGCMRLTTLFNALQICILMFQHLNYGLIVNPCWAVSVQRWRMHWMFACCVNLHSYSAYLNKRVKKKKKKQYWKKKPHFSQQAPCLFFKHPLSTGTELSFRSPKPSFYKAIELSFRIIDQQAYSFPRKQFDISIESSKQSTLVLLHVHFQRQLQNNRGEN